MSQVQTNSPATPDFEPLFAKLSTAVQAFQPHLTALSRYCTTAVTDDEDLTKRMALIDELYGYAKTEDDIAAIMAQFVTDKVYEYEQIHVQLPAVAPSEALAHFMEENKVKQRDLISVASQSVISEILHGKRKMTVKHIKGFAAFFGVPEKTFMG